MVVINNRKIVLGSFRTSLAAWLVRHRLQYPRPRFWMSMVVLAGLVWFYFSLPRPLFREPYSTIITDRNGVFQSAQIATDYQWRFPMADTVPLRFRECIRCFEDEYFYRHPGVNPVSLFRAIGQYFKHGRIVSGGSTLSMQLVRISRHNPPRTVGNKLLELILAFRLEAGYSKEEIMRMYAAHAPFGGNVVGLEAAAWRYYNRPASRLSWGETAALAVLPNAPALVFPGKNHLIFLRKRNRLLDKLCRLKLIDASSCRLAKLEPLPDKPHALPQLASHLLQKAMKDGYGGQSLRTTLDGRIQQFTTAVATKYARFYAENYIRNIAVLILNTRTGEVLAYVGNARVDGGRNQEYVDNVVAPRSSGSILKPFLYAAMLDEGELLPNSLVADVPTRIGGYAPENFEKTYAGAVPAGLALAHSLNIPAVRELEQYGVVRFHHFLQSLGFTTISRPATDYGLALILGGAEVSLYETTSVYASMARSSLSYHDLMGKFRSDDYRMANYLPPVPDALKAPLKTYSLLSAGSVWWTLEALSTLNRPWGEIGWEFFASTHKVSWKTGTSFGSRDAWAVGVTPEYTVGVWVGNSTGEGRAGLTGVTHAAPVMFELFKYLNPQAKFEEPRSDMIRLAVCKQSGYRATDLCESDTIYVPRKGSRVKTCPYHQSVFLDSTANYRVSGESYPVSSMRAKTYFILPPAQEYFYKRQHPEYESLPAWFPGCTPLHEHVLDILEPDNNSAIYIPKGAEGESGMLIFEAVHRNPSARVFWHLDNEFVSQTIYPHKIEIAPLPGMHVLTVEDEAGNMVRRRFRILSK